MFVFFFFQAEDGIRDLVRSRGLGDVYKRQAEYRIVTDVDDVDSDVTSYGTYTVEAGSNTVAKAP